MRSAVAEAASAGPVVAAATLVDGVLFVALGVSLSPSPLLFSSSEDDEVSCVRRSGVQHVELVKGGGFSPRGSALRCRCFCS